MTIRTLTGQGRNGRAGACRYLSAWAVGLVFAISGSAHAFSDPALYGEYAVDEESIGGGGGRYFTGSPADGYSCSACHTATTAYKFPVYVTGLPMNGYIPGTQYNVKLTWPEASQYSANALATTKQTVLPTGAVVATPLVPYTALTAEIVAEDGGNAGSLELPPPVLIQPGELCTLRPGEDVAPLAATIYETARGKDPVAITDSGVVCKTDRGDDARCVVTMRPCGASQLQVRWTAPSRWRGPIWFSAGFVTTADATAQPNDNDFVTELSIPIGPASDDARHDTVLESGCSVAGDPGARRSELRGLGLLLIAGLGLLRWRRRSSAAIGGAMVLLLMAALGSSACSSDYGKRPVGEVSDTVGAFEPADRVDAGAEAGVMMGANCPPAFPEPADDGGVGPAVGTLTVTFVSTPPTGVPVGLGQYDGKKPGQPAPNNGVVWIEDPTGLYVKTLEQWIGQYALVTLSNFYLTKMRAKCPEDVADVVTGATADSHILHTSTWNGKTGRGSAVPAGMYVLWLDVSIDEQHPNKPASYPITIGAEPWTMMIPDAAPHMGLTLVYTPNK